MLLGSFCELQLSNLEDIADLGIEFIRVDLCITSSSYIQWLPLTHIKEEKFRPAIFLLFVSKNSHYLYVICQKVYLAHLICVVIVVHRALQMSGLVCRTVLMNYYDSVRERSLFIFSGFDLDDRPLPISKYLTNVSSKKQSDWDNQDVVVATSLMTKTLVFPPLYPCFFS